jgi:hypothetical protein
MCEPGSREIHMDCGSLGVPSRSTLDEGHVDVVTLEHSEVELPVVEEGGMPAQNKQRKPGTLAGRLGAPSPPPSRAASFRSHAIIPSGCVGAVPRESSTAAQSSAAAPRLCCIGRSRGTILATPCAIGVRGQARQSEQLRACRAQ